MRPMSYDWDSDADSLSKDDSDSLFKGLLSEDDLDTLLDSAWDVKWRKHHTGLGSLRRSSAQAVRPEPEHKPKLMTAPGAPFLCNGCKEPGYGPRLVGSPSSNTLSAAPARRRRLRLERVVRPEPEHKPFLCNGCKEPGYGPRSEQDFSGGCHSSDLHTRCARADDPLSGLHTLVQPLFGYGKHFQFRFLHEPPHQGRLCDACGEPTRGFVYHCSEQDVHLHPCCASLPNRLLHDGRAFDLHRRASRSCALCLQNEGRGRWFWAYRCYVDGVAIELHVACLKKTARRSREAFYRNRDAPSMDIDHMLENRFGEIAGTVASFITALVFGNLIVNM